MRSNPLHLDSVGDPFEPSFHERLRRQKRPRRPAGAARRAVVYHGTSTALFWPIVEHGLMFDESRKAWGGTTPGVYVAFDEDTVGLYAYHAVEKFGGQPMAFVCEVPVADLDVDPDDRNTHDKGRNLQATVQGGVVPSDIVGVLFLAEGAGRWAPEVPLRDVIKRALRDGYRNAGIDSPPDPERARGLLKRPAGWHKRREPDPEMAVLNYLTSVLQATELESYLYQPELGKLHGAVLGWLLEQRGRAWVTWAAPQWYAQVRELLLGETPAEAAAAVAADETFQSVASYDRELRLPFYNVAKKYEHTR